MSQYQGLSRTYRPQTFSAVLGQEAIVTTLKNALRQKKTAQAYLFCGTRGTGKTTLARVLAKALNCPNLSKDSEPCNQCPSCLEISQGKNLNVLEIDGASNRGIDDIRQLNETVAYAPTTFGCKIFIIDEAHMLTKEAFNALLKTLEEPPPNVKFFLATTEAHKIPPTIISRCQKFDLQRISTATITHKLTEMLKEQHFSYEEEALHAIATLSDGSMRVAESLLDQILCFSEGSITEKQVSNSLGTLPTEDFFAFDDAFAQNNILFAFLWANQIFTSGKDLPHFFSCLLDHYRTLLSTKLQLSLEKIPASLQEKYIKSCANYTEEQLLYILDYLIEWHDKIHKNPCKRVTLEMALLHVLRSRYRISATDLVMRLEALQETPPSPSPSATPLPIKEIPPTPSLVTPLKTVQEPPKKEAPPVSPKLEIPAEIPQPVLIKEIATPPQPSFLKQAIDLTEKDKEPLSKNLQARYDTLSRFAAVELEGTLSKE